MSNIKEKYIEECKAQIKKYEAKYGATYHEFYDKIIDMNGKDQDFIEKLEKENPTYENDFITWGPFKGNRISGTKI